MVDVSEYPCHEMFRIMLWVFNMKRRWDFWPLICISLILPLSGASAASVTAISSELSVSTRTLRAYIEDPRIRYLDEQSDQQTQSGTLNDIRASATSTNTTVNAYGGTETFSAISTASATFDSATSGTFFVEEAGFTWENIGRTSGDAGTPNVSYFYSFIYEFELTSAHELLIDYRAAMLEGSSRTLTSLAYATVIGSGDSVRLQNNSTGLYSWLLEAGVHRFRVSIGVGTSVSSYSSGFALLEGQVGWSIDPVNVVPLPASAWLMIVGLGCLFGVGRLRAAGSGIRT